jgi:PAP2 superfamily
MGDSTDTELDSVGNHNDDDDDDDDDGGVVVPPDVVLGWSDLAVETAFALGTFQTDPFQDARGWSMMYLAMHDAINAIQPRYRHYAFDGNDPSADAVAAAAQAAHDVLNHIYPSRTAQNDAELAFWLGQVPDGAAETAGIALGQAAAAAIIANRANDNMLVFGSYTPDNPLEPGDYRFTPPFDFVYRPAFGDATTFAMGSVNAIQPGPPPPLFSFSYAIGLNEVKNFGRKNSTFRSQDQTNFAAWWLEFIYIQVNRMARDITIRRNLDLIDAVRLFAIGQMAEIDSTVAQWKAKRTYDFWRPFDAIHLADTDGNILTAPDATWEPEHLTPPLWEYPSAHTIQCWAVAEAFRRVLGTDNVSFSYQTSSALPSNPVRSFNRLSKAADECGVSRIMAGYHYRFSVNVGMVMGKEVGQRVVNNKLRPL